MTDAIKDMKLYTHFERVDRELLALGKEPGSKLEPSELYSFDHMNYYGTDAVANGVKTCKLDKDSKVLISVQVWWSGRYISTESGANVVALELQEDAAKALEYTTRCGTSNIRHVCADFITCDLEEVGLGKESFDAIVSCWLFSTLMRSRSFLIEPQVFVRRVGIFMWGFLYEE